MDFFVKNKFSTNQHWSGKKRGKKVFNSSEFHFFGSTSYEIHILISDTLSVGGCWVQLMLLFWKLVDETQMGNTRDHAARDISSKFSIFLPLRAILKNPYHYETPCISGLMKVPQGEKKSIDLLSKSILWLTLPRLSEISEKTWGSPIWQSMAKLAVLLSC